MKWEYKVKKMMATATKADVDIAQIETDLNSLGEQGWEAVSWWHTMHHSLDEHGVRWKIDTLVLFKRSVA